MGAIADFPATGAYENQSFFQGFIEGYNTMDALASLAFGIIVINVIKDLGLKTQIHCPKHHEVEDP